MNMGKPSPLAFRLLNHLTNQTCKMLGTKRMEPVGFIKDQNDSKR